MAEVAAAHNWRVNELGCVPGNRTGAETVACETGVFTARGWIESAR